jgi:hypothetical protein
MNKSVAIFVCLLLLYTMAHVQRNQIVRDGGEFLRIFYPNPQPGEDTRLRIRSRLSSKLTSLEASTVICFKSDSSYNVSPGADAFAIQFWCAIPRCDYNYQLGNSVFGSTAKSVNPIVWKGAGFDVSHTNRGVAVTRNGRNIDYLYGMSNSEFIGSHLPHKTNEAYYKCFYNFDGGFYDANLLTDIQLEDDYEWDVEHVHLN